jgi:2-oxoglutarate dehydrogenase E2 component (dihydrolipoamide succinyltransferase)
VTQTVEIRAPAAHTEGTRSQILRWLKRVGDPVAASEPLIELETDKVTVEIAAPGAGVLRQIVKDEQHEIEPGELLGVIESEAGAPSASDPVAAVSIPPHPPHESASAAGDTHAARPSAEATAPSPAVQRLLREHGLMAQQVAGTGAGGRITVDDVLRHASTPAREAVGAEVPRASAAAAVPSELIPHTAMRRRVAAHMVQSLLHTAPHVTTVFEADMSAVLAHRAQHRAAFERTRTPLTLTAYFIAAAAHALRAVPEANARWREEGLELFSVMNVGVATALGEQGLIVPVIHSLERRDFADIVRALDDLVKRARAARLAPEDVQGGTFTLSNHGVSGSLLAAPIVIPHGQAAILGIGKLEKRASIVQDDGVERVIVRPKCYVTLTIDHRVMDGYRANRFLQVFVQQLESWPQEYAPGVPFATSD